MNDGLLVRASSAALRRRGTVLSVWLVLVVAGAAASTRLAPLLSNDFHVPGSDSARAATILTQHFGDRSDGEYLVVLASAGRTNVARLQSAVDRAAALVPSAHAGPLQAARDGLFYDTVVSRLDSTTAKSYTAVLRSALHVPPGVRAYVTGQAALQHDLDPVFKQDLHRGEFEIALPVALLVLVAVLGVSAVITLPLLFAGATIATTLGLVFLAAHVTAMSTYVANLVELIGLALAIDYSLLVVYRFRDELRAGRDVDDAIRRTMATAGRSVVFSGATVALGLALLLFVPVPFVRSLGVAGLLIPIVSVAAATTLLPGLLALYGRTGTARVRFPFASGMADGLWHRLAGSIMRRPIRYALLGTAALLLAAAPALGLRLTPGSADGIPQGLPSVRGFDLLRSALGAGALSPTQIVIDAGAGERAPARATRKLQARLRADPEVIAVKSLTDPTRQFDELIVVGRHEYGSPSAQAFVRRVRTAIAPASGFPPTSRVLVGGGAAQGVDFLRRSYNLFPWLVLAVIALTYPLLLRAFRSVLLPLKAVLLNLLSVSASYGMLVVFFRYGVGAHAFGLYRSSQVEGWIPIFLFAMLFGLSMDYEVFLVTRMREAWDAGLDNGAAVAEGLERTGRIVTAAAIIMVATFSGFVAGRIAGLQEFGLGLAVAVFVDATIVRAVLLPSLMALFGRWNWWLPAGVAHIARVEPTPLTRKTHSLW